MQDLRKIKTETLIQNTFIDLLKEKSLYHITITDICTKAQINRSIPLYILVNYIVNAQF